MKKQAMEKILLAQDAQCLNTSAIDFACYLARLTHSRLTGVFLEDVLSRDRPEPKLVYGSRAQDSAAPAAQQMQEARTLTEENIRLFREACVCRGVTSRIHRDRGVPATEIIEESRFADLIVIDADTSFSRKNEPLPGRFVKGVLLEAECPIILAPYTLESIEEIFFAYNATPSSVFAIKAFTYLLPELTKKKITLLNVRNDSAESLDESHNMKEWLNSHYSELEIIMLKGDPADELFAYLLEKKNGMVVMGAYGRGMLSRFFKPSQARLILKSVNLPIFIAHR
jgi:nucleotide-binding universal stress UspA family protein